jgi:phosphoglycerol transferase MdoB-like AlkP superfamily enzyme
VKLPSKAWSVALVAVLFLVGVGVAAAAALVPTFGVTAIAIGLLLALRVKIKALALILVAACLLGPSLEEGLGIDALTYVDEAASIFLGIIVPIGSKLFGRKIVRLPGQNLLLVTLGLGLVSSLLQGVGTASFGQGPSCS